VEPTQPTQPAQTSAPSETDSSGPREAEPTPDRYDVALQTSSRRSGEGVTRITVTVTGLPAGRTATLTSRGDGLVVAQALDTRCLPTGIHASRCAVATSPTSVDFLAHATAPGSMTFEMSVDGAAPPDNRSSVQVH
jgi:hypothetical protein